MPKREHLHRQQGMSLITALMASAIMGISAMAVGKLMSTNQKATAKMSGKAKVDMIQRFVADNLDCINTVPADLCAGESERIIQGKNGANALIIPVNSGKGRTLYNWNVRVKCYDGGMNVQYAKFVGSTDNFARDPVTGDELSWTEMFEDDTMCASSFGSTGGTGNPTPLGECRYYEETFSRLATPLSSVAHRRHTQVCPSEYPVATASTIKPACAAYDYYSAIRKGGGDAFPSRANHVQVFLEDRVNLGGEGKLPHVNWGIDSGGNPINLGVATVSDLQSTCSGSGNSYTDAIGGLLCCKL